MDALRLETLSLQPVDRAQKDRRHAEQVAAQFEAIFVRTMVQSLRQSATLGGEGGMFGDGPGADTYADWFDQNVADHVCGSSRIGVKEILMADFARNGELGTPAATGQGARSATAVAATLDDSRLLAARAAAKGGIDVVR